MRSALALLVVALAARLAVAAPEPVTAIDVLLETDPAMTAKAVEANARLRGAFPGGFPFDATHVPHVTVIQRYVRSADLEKVFEAVGTIVAEEAPAAWKLQATGYVYSSWEGRAIASFAVTKTPELSRFQERIVAALAPFSVGASSASAFYAPDDDPEINLATRNWVASYVPGSIGAKYAPHVTIGLAQEGFVRKMIDEPFEPFTFGSTGAAIYQLGNFGTARKKLKGWAK